MVTPGAEPDQSLDGTALASLLHAEMGTIDELLLPCEKRFGRQRLATHQVLGPLSASQWRKFHLVHARHHLKQIRQLHLK